jgi:hypothetical protein
MHAALTLGKGRVHQASEGDGTTPDAAVAIISIAADARLLKAESLFCQ